MFYRDGAFFRSTILDEYEKYGVRHVFTTRHGGVSSLPHTKSMNLTYLLGDPDDVVRENIDIAARELSLGRLGGENVVLASQIHSSAVRVVGSENAGEGVSRERGGDCDGFATAEKNVIPLIRVADCVPVILAGIKGDGGAVISVVHAGWRGTVGGICSEAVRAMLRLGAEKSSISAAVGAHIGFCCFEVGEDFTEAVTKMRGRDFAARHVREFPGSAKKHADLASMNAEILAEAGVGADKLDFSPYCTACDTDTFYSHRRMHGVRGTMGAMAVIM